MGRLSLKQQFRVWLKVILGMELLYQENLAKVISVRCLSTHESSHCVCCCYGLNILVVNAMYQLPPQEQHTLLASIIHTQLLQPSEMPQIPAPMYAIFMCGVQSNLVAVYLTWTQNTIPSYQPLIIMFHNEFQLTFS